MDANPELINFNLIPPMHRYLHNATDSCNSCALNGKFAFRFRTEYEVFPSLVQQKAVVPFVFPTQWPLDNSDRRVGVDGGRCNQVICLSQFLSLPPHNE